MHVTPEIYGQPIILVVNSKSQGEVRFNTGKIFPRWGNRIYFVFNVIVTPGSPILDMEDFYYTAGGTRITKFSEWDASISEGDTVAFEINIDLIDEAQNAYYLN